MRKFALTIFAFALVAAGYVAYPFVTAWTIREAIHNGNSAYLQDKIEWDGVRASLRQSLSRIAVADTQAASADEPAPKPGLWKRIKAGIKQRAVDGLVDNYVTPEGLPQLFEYRQMYRKQISGEADAPKPAWHVRAASFWSRIKRAEFKTPTAFEFEMADRNDPNRHYIGLLRLRRVEWKLSELQVRMVEAEDLPAPAADTDTGTPDEDEADESAADAS